ncbi:MAG: hypothetical protein OEZ16_02875 [Chromatiales bacterium]|nr:hypothetical protein [Chromatiales bacterium]
MTRVTGSLILLLLSACASLDQAIPHEFRYGQLYALSDALSSASNNCGDRDESFSATYWASVTVDTLDQFSRLLRSDSPEQLTSRKLVTQLYALSYEDTGDNGRCEQFAVAGTTTRELLSLLRSSDS